MRFRLSRPEYKLAGSAVACLGIVARRRTFLGGIYSIPHTSSAAIAIWWRRLWGQEGVCALTSVRLPASVRARQALATGKYLTVMRECGRNGRYPDGRALAYQANDRVLAQVLSLDFGVSSRGT